MGGVGKSVSRVGGKAQRAAYRAVAGDLKLAYAQFEELETFARFGARLDDDTRKIIEHGWRIRSDRGVGIGRVLSEKRTIGRGDGKERTNKVWL